MTRKSFSLEKLIEAKAEGLPVQNPLPPSLEWDHWFILDELTPFFQGVTSRVITASLSCFLCPVVHSNYSWDRDRQTQGGITLLSLAVMKGDRYSMTLENSLEAGGTGGARL